MRIGYEAKRAFLNTTGLGNYCRVVIKMMASYFPDEQYFLYTPKIGHTNRVGFMDNVKNISVKTPESGLFKSLWRSKGVVTDLKRDGIEIYHGLSHELPLGIHQSGIKSVVTIHDLIFKRRPGDFGLVSRQIYNAKVKYACKHAGKIVAISQKTKADLVELLHINPSKIEVVYQDCDSVFKTRQTGQQLSAVKLQYQLPNKYLLTIGTIEERKNLLLLIKALRLLPQDTQLVVVGKHTAYAEKVKVYVKTHSLESRVIFITTAQFAHLPAIYQLAEVFIYPSRYEGFGLPVLEAITSGIPVIAATGSCLEEAGGPDSIYVNPDNETELAEKLQYVLSNTRQRKIMIEKGLQYALKFDEKLAAAKMIRLYKNLLNHA